MWEPKYLHLKKKQFGNEFECGKMFTKLHANCFVLQTINKIWYSLKSVTLKRVYGFGFVMGRKKRGVYLVDLISDFMMFFCSFRVFCPFSQIFNIRSFMLFILSVLSNWWRSYLWSVFCRITRKNDNLTRKNKNINAWRVIHG